MRLLAALFGTVVVAQTTDTANRPVAKVLKLMNEMKTNLEKEIKADEELFEKMECWCKTNRGQKSKAVDEAQRKIADLEAAIEEYTAKAAQLSTEIKNLEADIKKNQESLAEATALREKELAEFQAEEKELIETINSLGQALKALAGVHGEAFLQSTSFVQLQQRLTMVPNKFQDVMRKDLWDMLGSFQETTKPELAATQVVSEMFLAPGKEGKATKAMLQQPTGAAAGAKSYNAQSGEIYGVLKQMKEDFETKLGNARETETTASQRFDAMKAALLKELAAQDKSLKNKRTQLANTNQANAQAKQEVEDTTAALTADQRFLVDLEKKCKTSDEEYQARQKERNDEITAIGEAIGILTDDESRDLFSRTFNFVQKSSSVTRHVRQRAAQQLLGAAKKMKSYELAALAVSAQLDAFTKVKKAMDDMLAQLKAQQKDEYKHKEFCRVELDANEDDIKDKNNISEDTQSTITDLQGQIDTLTKELEVLNVEIANSRVSIKQAGEDRAAENKEFQTTINDQRLTKNVLNKALVRLQDFYEKKASFIQQPENVPGQASAPPPPKAQAYQNQGAAPGVMGLIQMIIKDAEIMEAEATKDEQDAQKNYAQFVTNSNNSIRAAQRGIENKTAARAGAEMSKSENEATLQDTTNLLEVLHNENGDLHKSCDFVVKNFDVRQEARQQEMEAIEQAKAVLSGADFS